MLLDAGGVSGRRRRDLRLSLFLIPLFLANSFILSVLCCQCFVFAFALLHSGGLPRLFLVGNGGIESSLSGHGLTGSGFLWRIPHKFASFTTYGSWESMSLKICIAGTQAVDNPPPCEADSSQRFRSITLRQASRVSSDLLTCYADLHTGEYQPSFWIDTTYHLGSGLGNNITFVDLVSSKVFNFLVLSSSNSSASKSTCTWRDLTTLVNFLKIIEGFLGIFTETGMQPMSYLSYGKSSLSFLLLMDSPGQPTSSSSLTSFSPKKRAVLSPASFTRIVSPPNVKRRCLSLSITVLSSCVAVRSEPKDATDVISIIFRGADWILTSQLKVTKFQVYGGAMNLALTHSSFAVNSLSFYRRGLFTIILYAVLSLVGRVWLNSIFIWSSNV